MSEREWQFGDWAETVFGTRIRVVHEKHPVRFIDIGGAVYNAADLSKLKHLPDCTSFSWQPPAAIDPGEGWRLLGKGEVPQAGDEYLQGGKQWVPSCLIGHQCAPPYRRRLPPPLQLREGAWYERADKEIVGPCKQSNVRHSRPWKVGCFLYSDDGRNSLGDERFWLIREVSASEPTPTVAQSECTVRLHFDSPEEANEAFDKLAEQYGSRTQAWRPATIDDLKRAPIEARFRDVNGTPWSKPLRLVGFRYFAEHILWRSDNGSEWRECEVQEQGPAV